MPVCHNTMSRVNGKYARRVSQLSPLEQVEAIPRELPGWLQGLYSTNICGSDTRMFSAFLFRPGEQQLAIAEIKNMALRGQLSATPLCYVQDDVLRGWCIACENDRPIRLWLRNFTRAWFVCDKCTLDYIIDAESKTCTMCGRRAVDAFTSASLLMGAKQQMLACSLVCLRKARQRIIDECKDAPIMYLCANSMCQKQLTRASEGKQGDGKFCGRCYVAVYCGPQCQKQDWPKHKTVCK